MKAATSIFVVFSTLLFSSLVLANEPFWTPEQRKTHRNVVIDATVKEVHMIKKLPTKDVNLMKAILTIQSVSKGQDHLTTPTEVDVYFEHSPLGAGYRCPSYPNPHPQQLGRFYLQLSNQFTKEEVLFLAMGSDVQTIPLNRAEVMPKIKEAIDNGPSYHQIDTILGASYIDIGSANHEFLYTFQNGSFISVGTSLGKKQILYINDSGKRIFTAKTGINPIFIWAAVAILVLLVIYLITLFRKSRLQN